MNWLRAHFRKHRQRRPWDFCWRVAVEGLVVSLIVVAIPSILLDEPGRDFLDWPIHHTLIIIVILAPIFETLLLQALPVAIARLVPSEVEESGGELLARFFRGQTPRPGSGRTCPKVLQSELAPVL